MRFSLLAIALLTLAGCDSGPGSASRLELVVSQTRFAPGDEVLVVLDNDTGKDATYIPCPVLNVVQGRNTFLPVEAGVVCPGVLARIEAGQSIPFRIALPEGIEAGQYIVTLPVDARDPTVFSGIFDVAPR